MSSPGYSIKGLDKIINWVVGFIFYYRLVFVLIALGIIYFFETRVWQSYSGDERLKTMATVLTGGSIIIAIFYSILNYEYNQTKFRHDVKTSRDVLTFNTASKTHDPAMIKNFRIIKEFYKKNKDLINGNQLDAFNKLLNEDTETRASFISIFNFFECVSLGILQGIIDEKFTKEFFKTIFSEFNTYFGAYIEYTRKEFGTPRIFRNFTNLAERWNKEN